MNIIKYDDLKHIATGAAVLGTGGGGNPYQGLIMSQKILGKDGSVPLKKVEDLTKDDLICTVAGYGAPSVTIERIPNIDEFVFAVKELEKEHGKKVTGIYPIEAGGSNSMVPLIAASTLNVELIDGDSMGRAYPKLNMITSELNDINMTPIILTNPKLEHEVIYGDSLPELEDEIRAKVVKMGASANIAFGLVDGETFKKFAIKDIVTLSYKIGKIVNDSQDPFTELIKECDATVLFNAKIVDITRKIEGGFNKGYVKLQGINSDEGKTFRVDIQNENIVAYEDDRPICMVPDLIALLDEQNAQPITTDSLKFGQRIKAVAFSSDQQWKTERGIKLGGPGQFGYDFEYEPFIKGDKDV